MPITKSKVRGTVYDLVGAGAPTNGTSGTGAKVAGIGSTYTDTTNKRRYINRGTKASPTWEMISRIVSAVGTGHNNVGACTATGFKVGDTVVTVLNLTDGTDDSAKFESAITVADQIQQSDAGNLSAKKYLFQVER